MPGIGTIVNALAVVAGGTAGILAKKGIPERFKQIIFTASSTAVFAISVIGMVTASVTAAEDGLLSSSYLLGLLLSLVLGGAIGELVRIDRLLDRLGTALSKKAQGGSEGFVTASVIFCVGAMAIVGSINDGAVGDPSMLYTKAVIDGITAFIFASVYGAGVILAAFSVAVYQGVFTLLAAILGSFLPPAVITQMTFTGSSVMLLISFSLWDIKKFNIANMLPAIFMPILLSFLHL